MLNDDNTLNLVTLIIPYYCYFCNHYYSCLYIDHVASSINNSVVLYIAHLLLSRDYVFVFCVAKKEFCSSIFSNIFTFH